MYITYPYFINILRMINNTIIAKVRHALNQYVNNEKATIPTEHTINIVEIAGMINNGIFISLPNIIIKL